MFDALLKSDSDLSRSTPFNLLSDALSTAAPAASAPEIPQSACQPLCTGELSVCFSCAGCHSTGHTQMSRLLSMLWSQF